MIKSKIKFLIVGLFAISSLTITPLKAQYKSAIKNETVLFNNVDGQLPLGKLDQYTITVSMQDSSLFGAFKEQLSRYGSVNYAGFDNFDEHIKYSNVVIVAMKSEELTAGFVTQLQQAMLNNKKVILAIFGKGEALSLLDGLKSPVLWNEHATIETQKNAAMTIFGGLSAVNKLTKTYSNSYIKGMGEVTNQTRIQYSQGKNADINIEKLTKRIDAIAEEAIAKEATPGAVVMVVKNGQVIFEKGYGYHTYAKKVPTTINNIFDMASVSKIVGTTPVIMRLTEQGIVDLNKPIGAYLWLAKSTNKKDIPLRSVMLHEAGFTPFIPFYKYLKPGDVQRYYSSTHNVKVADSAYLVNHYYRDVMWPEMLKSEVKPIGNYVYSDISMYVMKEVAEHQTGEPMQDYVQENFYRPLGMKTAGYNPRERFAKEMIIPTENDTSFRKVLLQGYVHDQGAAMAGGVAGHAGLFASANDLAIYGQLLLNRGEYGGERFFKSETVDKFTSRQSTISRRGLGFDRWDSDLKKEYPSKLANSSVFGHTGYTGTCIWIDPQNQLVYIFLSNRVHPQVSTKLLDLNIRSRIQDAIYETIAESKK
ncbi:beta-lactamase family protein [Sphingobacterium sp. SRCM116780]|uniref:serine hydrolase domain-containing protein n=1 Tax=Sphingobacterium sp. SRCM116780 TaxID=2907623 RepID=UPI001F1E74C4|nr:serine hydrolase domain-containing protein [Sphingobacterium sp. SRCM116780]UIR55666.1 beta-lactamase family protein [Sphingobacterium sp. SRCM116780]